MTHWNRLDIKIATGEKQTKVHFFLRFEQIRHPWPRGGPVKYDIVHMRDQAFSNQPLNEFGSLPKNNP